MSSNNAFTAVSARRTFARPIQPSTQANAPIPGNAINTPERSKRDWPEPVRQYVQRAFAAENSLPGISRQEMETKLKQTISESASSNTLHLVDWTNLPLPQQMIQQEHVESAKSVKLPSIPVLGNNFPTVSPATTNLDPNNTKKRKSSEWDDSQAGNQVQPPWRATNNRNVFEDRISYPDKRPKNDMSGKTSSKSQHHIENRKKRFESGQTAYAPPPSSISAVSNLNVKEEDPGPVVGRCQDLEKKYFRLTSAPNPMHVRPLEVLEKTLDLLKKKWRKENNYSYICDQFKSLRQDLTVQHIKTEFTVNVYEIHARIALEKGDLGEYNQCQTQLRALYSQNLGGHPMEFKAYRILYFIHTCNRTDMNDVLADLTTAEKKDEAVKHALDARSALALGNYHRFFQLYLDTPNMGAYLMDMFVGRERLAALSNICKAYKPDVRLRFITEELGFESDDESARFICEHGGQGFLGERDDTVRLQTGKSSHLFESAKHSAFRRVDISRQI